MGAPEGGRKACGMGRNRERLGSQRSGRISFGSEVSSPSHIHGGKMRESSVEGACSNCTWWVEVKGVAFLKCVKEAG